MSDVLRFYYSPKQKKIRSENEKILKMVFFDNEKEIEFTGMTVNDDVFPFEDGQLVCIKN